MSEELARQLAAMLSQKLVEHLSLLEAILEVARGIGATPGREGLTQLAGMVDNLKSVMSSMSSDVYALIGLVEKGSIDPETLREVYALAGYYVEAGSRTEAAVEEILRPIMGDPGFDHSLRQAFEKLYLLAEAAYRRRGFG